MTFCAQFIHFRPHFAFAEKQSCNLKKKNRFNFQKKKVRSLPSSTEMY